MGRQYPMVRFSCSCVYPRVDVLPLCAVNFDAGPSFAGLMPISGAANETRKLFFWYHIRLWI